MLSNQQIDRFFRGALVEPGGGRLKYIPSDSYESFVTPYGNDKIVTTHGTDRWFSIVNLDTADGFGTHWVGLLQDSAVIYADSLGGHYYRLPEGLRRFLKRTHAQHIIGRRDPLQIKNILDERGKASADTFCGAYAIGLLLPYLINRGAIKPDIVKSLQTLFGITADPASAKKMLAADAIVDDFARWITGAHSQTR